jgi:hypothetical protein
MRYAQITSADVDKLYPALKILERVDHESSSAMDYCLYGLTSDPGIIAYAESALQEFYSQEEDQQTYKLTDIAISIGVSSDVLYHLSGSGLRADTQTFAYQNDSNEGVRTAEFTWSPSGGTVPRLTVNDFSVLAMADGDSWLDEFYKEFRNKLETSPETLERTEPAVEEPHGEGDNNITEPVPVPPGDRSLRSTSSVKKIREIIEDFLG